jgi:hypothetical protein
MKPFHDEIYQSKSNIAILSLVILPYFVQNYNRKKENELKIKLHQIKSRLFLYEFHSKKRDIVCVVLHL